jgi:hypothetical protein
VTHTIWTINGSYFTKFEGSNQLLIEKLNPLSETPPSSGTDPGALRVEEKRKLRLYERLD